MTKKNAPVVAEAGNDVDTVSSDTNYSTLTGNSAEQFEKFFEEAKAQELEGFTNEFQMSTKDSRMRAFTGILYPESMNKNTLSILNNGQFQGALSPLHDKDRWKDGKPKKAHYHCILYYPGKMSLPAVSEACKKTFGMVRVQPVYNLIGMVRYLAHLDIRPDKIEDDKGKVHYSPDDIMSFGGFDVMSRIKATHTQVTQGVGELIKHVKERGITNYADYLDFVFVEHVDLAYIATNNTVDHIMKSYIIGNYQRMFGMTLAQAQCDYYLDKRVKKDTE